MSKLKAIKPKEALPSKPKIAVMGKFGVGKTWGLLDFPSTYFIDTEGGANLAHYIDKLHKSGGIYFGPSQGADDFQTVINEVKTLATEKHPYKTLVIDSLSKLFNSEITKEAERLGEKDAFGASKRPAVRLSARLMHWIEKIDMSVILVTHEKAEWANKEQVGTMPDAGDKLGHELHLLLQIVKMGESRKAFVRKTRLLGFPDGSSFDWNYQEFAKRYGKNVMESAVKPVVLATVDQLAKIKELLEVVKLSDSAKDKWIAENSSALSEIESEKADGIIKHLQSKIVIPQEELPPFIKSEAKEKTE